MGRSSNVLKEDSDLQKEIAYWSYQKKASIMEGDLQGALESDKNIQQLLQKRDNV
jgi:hypothetical protein